MSTIKKLTDLQYYLKFKKSFAESIFTHLKIFYDPKYFFPYLVRQKRIIT